MPDLTSLEHWEAYLDIYIMVFLGIASIPGIIIAKTPCSRPSYVKALFLVCALDFVIAFAVAGVVTYAIHTDNDNLAGISIVIAVLGLIATTIWFMCQHARRIIDMQWSKWWFLICATGVGWWIITIIPLFYKTRLAGKKNQEISDAESDPE